MVKSLKNIFLKEPLPFTDKRDINWSFIKKISAISMSGLIFILLFIPEEQAETNASFSEERSQTIAEKESEIDKINHDTLNLLSRSYRHGNSKNLDHLYARNQISNESKHSQSMVIARTDLNSGNTLPMSTKILLIIPTAIKVEGNQIPIMAFVKDDVYYKDSLAIPKNSALFGHASLSDSDRVNIDWSLVQFSDGSEKKIQATSVGTDGRVGVPGKLEGNSSTNAAGQPLSSIIAAYAEGSKETGPLGANRGGHKNGVRNAVAETARSRSESWAKNLQKEVRWVTLEAGIETYALVTQPFVFRDPGATYGQ